MSEFKFACPVCGQHIKCDSSQSGTTMECPTCFQKIVAPHAPATDDSKFILTGTKLGERQISTAFGKSANGRATRKTPSVLAVLRRFPAVTIVVLVALLGATAAVLLNFTGSSFNSVSTTTGGTNQTGGRTKNGLPPDGSQATCSSAGDMAWTLNFDSVRIPNSAAAGYV
ncbi:MAG TPA: hypothetical protein VKA67_07220, partial [Verrucomicrobiae bacterium]|nr:hypothetical protein [Verrucomicrobiae bacterium]